MACPASAGRRASTCISCSSFRLERGSGVTPACFPASRQMATAGICSPSGRGSSRSAAGCSIFSSPEPAAGRDSSYERIRSFSRASRPTIIKGRNVCAAASNASENGTRRSLSPPPPFSPSKQPHKPSSAGGASTSNSCSSGSGEAKAVARNTSAEAMSMQRSIAPIGDSEDSNGKASACALTVSVSEVPVRRRRGRPPGIPAWNKNKKMPAKTREKISKTKKAQWKDPEYRNETYQAFNTVGQEPWNKGKAMSPETRQKMAEAKRGKTLSKAARRKLSLAHSRRPGPGHTPETRAALSAKLSGKSKSPAHRAAISAGQRRRSAAARVLAAVEGVHRELSANHASNGGRSSSYEAAARRSSRGTGSIGGYYSSASPTKAQLLGAYKAQLHEYRNLQEELQPWTTAFTNKEGRKPTLRDVEATGIDWLIVKYKQYILLREHLLREVPSLRQADSGAYGPAASGGAKRPSNSVMGSPSSREAGSRMQLAMEYRQKMMMRQQGKTPANEKEEEEEEKEQDRLRNMVSSSASGTNQRASSALQAALNYREDKAKLSAAKARAAAAMAGGGAAAAKRDAINKAAGSPAGNEPH